MNDRSPETLERRSCLRRLLNRAEVDRAVFYALTARLWQLLAGPVTLILIAWHFAPETQGYYYTFWSLIALQSFFELSFPQVIINFASHEWERVNLNQAGGVEGDADAISRLSSLLRLSLLWYGTAAALFVVVVTLAGFFFFSYGTVSNNVEWQLPWFALVLLTAITFATIPCFALLEGCNQVKSVYKLQLVQAVAGNLVVWAAISLGAGLWTLALSVVVRLLAEAVLVAGTYRRFFRDLLKRQSGPAVHWRDEVWPFQWRLAVKAVVTYFNTYFMNLVIFGYHGEVLAGRFGMTWQVLTSLNAACTAWLRTRAARFGMLVANQNYRELDRLFFRLTIIAVVALTLASTAFCLFTLAISQSGSLFAARLLTPGPTIVLAIGTTLALVSSCQWIYIHAHKRSPYLFFTVFGSLLTGFLIWALGRTHGAIGVASAYTGVMAVYYFPLWTWAWQRCRSEWHGVLPEIASMEPPVVPRDERS